MDPVSIILAIVTLLNFAFATVVFLHTSRGRIARAYVAVAVSLAVWSACILFYRRAPQETAHLWAVLLYISSSFISSSILYFAYLFPEAGRPSVPIRFLIGGLNLGAIALVAIPGLVIEAVAAPSFGIKIITWGSLYPLYFAYIVGVLYWAFILLIIKIRRSSGIVRTQLWYVFLAFFIVANLSFVTNVMLPILGWFGLGWIGPALTVGEVAVIAYAMIQYKLLEMRAVAAEILTIVIVSVLAGELLLAQTPEEFALRLAFFLTVIVFSAIVVKSTIREVRQREQVQQLANQLEVANTELERLDKAKSEFLSIASHQLRTPLTAIKGYASMLLDGTFGKVNGKAGEGIQKVYDSTERMVALVNDLLDTARVESGRMKFTVVDLDLVRLATSVCEELMPKAAAKHMEIRCAPDVEAIPHVFGDEQSIRQVMMNLVDNAVKYSEQGPVEVALTHGNFEVIFSVYDHGQGMTPDEMKFLFKKFSRGSDGTTHIKGSGLGLYVCRRLIEAHGGRVWADSRGKGQGSTFSFALKVGVKPTISEAYKPE